MLSKHDFVRRYEQGEFGNHAPTWDTLAAFLDSGYQGLVHIRNRVAGGVTWYNVPAQRVRVAWQRSVAEVGDGKQLYISAMAPTEQTLFQGEVQRSVCYLDMSYSTLALPMRDALRRDCRQARGIMAVCLLQWYLCPRSYDWLQFLLDTYPDHVIEFSVYDCCWGTLPGYNTVFWEVRRY